MEEECKDCYEIVCRGCGWQPNKPEFIKIKEGTLTTCPKCNWSPKQNLASKE